MKLVVTFGLDVQPPDVQAWVAKSSADLLHDIYTEMLREQEVTVTVAAQPDALDRATVALSRAQARYAQAAQATRPLMLDLFGVQDD